MLPRVLPPEGGSHVVSCHTEEHPCSAASASRRKPRRFLSASRRKARGVISYERLSVFFRVYPWPATLRRSRRFIRKTIRVFPCLSVARYSPSQPSLHTKVYPCFSVFIRGLTLRRLNQYAAQQWDPRRPRG